MLGGVFPVSHWLLCYLLYPSFANRTHFSEFEVVILDVFADVLGAVFAALAHSVGSFCEIGAVDFSSETPTIRADSLQAALTLMLTDHNGESFTANLALFLGSPVKLRVTTSK